MKRLDRLIATISGSAARYLVKEECQHPKVVLAPPEPEPPTMAG